MDYTRKRNTVHCQRADPTEPALSEEWSRLDISTEVGEYEKYIKGREDDSADPVDSLRHHSELSENIAPDLVLEIRYHNVHRSNNTTV